MSQLASVVLLTLAVVVPSWAFNCPVVIKQAEDLVRKAEAGKLSPDTPPLLDEAKKQLAEAKAHHENRSEEHTSEIQSQSHLGCRLLVGTKNRAYSAFHRPHVCGRR